MTVLEARELKRVYMGDYYWYPNPGYMFVELTVKVSNKKDFPVRVPWQNVYVVEEDGSSWYPYWAGYKAVESGKTVDGSSIGVNEIVDGADTINFEEDVMLRLIWLLVEKEKTTILFGFDDSPQVEISFP
jgi:hypothetical protein